MLAVALPLAGCGAPAEAVGQTHEAIVGGAASDSSQDYVVQVVSATTACTGILVTPELVMTAQHCVVEGEGITTGANDITDCSLGTTPQPASGMLPIQFGPDGSAMKVPVSKVFVDEANDDCSKDVAFLQLATPVTSVPVHPLYLDGIPALGTAVTEIGWGAVDDAFELPQTRQQRSGTIVLTPEGGDLVTPSGADVKGSVMAGFLGASITSCSGDSGAPWVDGSGNIVGMMADIVSGGTIEHNGSTQSKCSDSVSLAVSLQSVRPFVTEVFQATGRMPWRASQANPPADVGAGCSSNQDCNSNFCTTVGTVGTCSTPCSQASDCASGTVCTDTGGPTSVCLPPSARPRPRGCSVVAGRDADGNAGSAAAILGLALAASCRLAKRRNRS